VGRYTAGGHDSPNPLNTFAATVGIDERLDGHPTSLVPNPMTFHVAFCCWTRP
jgi:hypothetical protein